MIVGLPKSGNSTRTPQDAANCTYLPFSFNLGNLLVENSCLRVGVCSLLGGELPYPHIWPSSGYVGVMQLDCASWPRCSESSMGVAVYTCCQGSMHIETNLIFYCTVFGRYHILGILMAGLAWRACRFLTLQRENSSALPFVLCGVQ